MKRFESDTKGQGLHVGVVVSRFNEPVCEQLLAGALQALRKAGVADADVTVASVPGALEIPLTLQRLAQTKRFDALVALGAVIRGETYHFEVVSNESARGVMDVELEYGIPIGNGILTTENDEQAFARAAEKGRDVALAAIEMANLIRSIDGWR